MNDERFARIRDDHVTLYNTMRLIMWIQVIGLGLLLWRVW